jgi:hypothetical protein
MRTRLAVLRTTHVQRGHALGRPTALQQNSSIRASCDLVGKHLNLSCIMR